jgi:hypothetical protein
MQATRAHCFYVGLTYFCVAMADGHHVLLLWLYILRLCLPPVLLVSVSSHLPNVTTRANRIGLFPRPTTATACAIAVCSKSPRSRTAKRTTSGSYFSPLSCSWYVYRPSRCKATIERPTFLIRLSVAGPIPALQPPVPLLAARLRADLLLVTPTPLHAHLALRPAHHHRAVSALCARRVLLGAERHVARCGERSRGLCRRPHRLVHP